MVTNWNNIRAAQAAIYEWASKTFPKRTTSGVWLKLYGEAAEAISNPGDPHELADVFILLIDLAAMQKIDLAKAIGEKMEINYNRRWIWDDAIGLAQHMKDRPDEH